MDEANGKDNIFEALDKAKKAMPSEAFLNRMENLALAYTNKVRSFSRISLVGIAAVFLFLIAANIYVVNNYHVQDLDTAETAPSDTYNLVPTKSIY